MHSNTTFILDMILAQNPQVDSIGPLYSLSEVNSITPIAQAKEYLEGKGISYIEQTANTNDEIIAAAAALTAAGVDAIFTPTDNKIMSAELAIAPALAEAGIPIIPAPTPLFARGLCHLRCQLYQAG